MKKIHFLASFTVGIALLVVPFAFTYAENTVSVSSISPGSSVPVGTKIIFTMSSNGIAKPSYGVSDSTPNSTINISNISGDIFTWTPTTDDLGIHNFTIIVSDSSGGLGNATTPLTITVTPSFFAKVNALTPGSTVAVNQPVTFTVAATGFSSPRFYINDSNGNSSLGNTNIDADGNVKWTPSSQETGEHVISISVVDSANHSTIIRQTINVISQGSTVPTPTLTPTPIVTPGTIVTPSSVSISTDPIKIYPTQFSPGTVSLKLNQKSNVTLSGRLINSYAISYNSNPNVVQASVNGTTLSLNGLNSGASVLVICSATNDCGAIPVAVNTVNSYLAAFATPAPAIVYGPTPVPTPAVVARSALTANISSGIASKISATLKLGMTSPEVTQLQKKLTALGLYSGPVTGYFGALTQSAVKEFQTSAKLDPLGFVGPATRAALNK